MAEPDLTEEIPPPPEIGTIPISESEMELVAVVQESNEQLTAAISELITQARAEVPIQELMALLNFDGIIEVGDIQAAKAGARDWAIGNSVITEDVVELDPDSFIGRFFGTGQVAQDTGNAVGEASVSVGA